MTSPESTPTMHTGSAAHHRIAAVCDRTPAATIGTSSGIGAPSPATRSTRNRPAYLRCSMKASTNGTSGNIHRAEVVGQCILRLSGAVVGSSGTLLPVRPRPRSPSEFRVAHRFGRQKEPFHGGQTLRRRSLVLYLQRAPA